MNSFARIAVVGLGYIGLPTAAVFAENGVEVVGVDVNAARGGDDQRRPAAFRRAEPRRAGAPRGRGGQAARHPDDGAGRRLHHRRADAAARSRRERASPDISYVEDAARALAPVLAAGQSGDPGIHLAGRHHRAHGGDPRRAAPRPQLPPAARRAGRRPGGALPRARAARPHPRRGREQRPRDRRHDPQMRPARARRSTGSWSRANAA